MHIPLTSWLSEMRTLDACIFSHPEELLPSLKGTKDTLISTLNTLNALELRCLLNALDSATGTANYQETELL